MGSLRIIPDQIFHQYLVKGLWFIQFIYVPVNELFLKGSIESLQVTIGLRMAWVVEEMYEGAVLTVMFKVFGEFSAIVGLDSGCSKGDDTGELAEEISTIGRRVRPIGTGKSELMPDNLPVPLSLAPTSSISPTAR